jgi:hypothetical protein
MGISQEEKWGEGEVDSTLKNHATSMILPKQYPRRHFFGGVLFKAAYLSDFKEIATLNILQAFYQIYLQTKLSAKNM